MYPKNKCKSLIEEYAPYFIEKLKIKGRVNWVVIKSTSKKAKAMKIDYKGHKGLSFINSKGEADIIIYYDEQTNEKDTISTIIHELLHVAVAKLSGLVTVNLERAHKSEEVLVLTLENIIIDLLCG